MFGKSILGRLFKKEDTQKKSIPEVVTEHDYPEKVIEEIKKEPSREEKLFKKVNEALALLDYAEGRSGSGVAEAKKLLAEYQIEINSLSQEEFNNIKNMKDCDAKRYIIDTFNKSHMINNSNDIEQTL